MKNVNFMLLIVLFLEFILLSFNKMFYTLFLQCLQVSLKVHLLAKTKVNVFFNVFFVLTQRLPLKLF